MEEQEEKQGLGFIGNAVQLVILGWALAVISYSYFGNSTRQIDTTFAAGLLSAVMSNYGLNVKKATDKKKLNGNVKIVDNSDSKVGVSKK
jgi:hypothetical protein|tara:strand:- start:116 stop:385 length:270 start_codon:yes stop_codon:yes gene_type:complete